jgi:hypothetical protein
MRFLTAFGEGGNIGLIVAWEALFSAASGKGPGRLARP